MTSHPPEKIQLVHRWTSLCHQGASHPAHVPRKPGQNTPARLWLLPPTLKINPPGSVSRLPQWFEPWPNWKRKSIHKCQEVLVPSSPLKTGPTSEAKGPLLSWRDLACIQAHPPAPPQPWLSNLLPPVQADRWKVWDDQPWCAWCYKNRESDRESAARNINIHIESCWFRYDTSKAIPSSSGSPDCKLNRFLEDVTSRQVESMTRIWFPPQYGSWARKGKIQHGHKNQNRPSTGPLSQMQHLSHESRQPLGKR